MTDVANNVVIDHKQGKLTIDGQEFPWMITIPGAPTVSTDEHGLHTITLGFFATNVKVIGDPDTTPTAGQWIHDHTQLEALPAGSIISDRRGKDLVRNPHHIPDGWEWVTSPGGGVYTDWIPLPAYVSRVGPAPRWGNGEIAAGEAETGALYIKALVSQAAEAAVDYLNRVKHL